MNKYSNKNNDYFALFRKNVDIFISHSNADTAIACKYSEYFDELGFKNAWTYENRIGFGHEIDQNVEENIKKCEFFILVVSDEARNSAWVQRELGLALKLLKENGGFRPIIIPISVRNDDGKANLSPFLCKDFHSGQNLPEPYPLDKMRSFDEKTPADSINFLVDMMTPKLSLVGNDIATREELIETGVFTLYESMFPLNERIPTDRLIEVLFTASSGKHPIIKLDNRFGPINIPKRYKFQRETIMLVLTISGKAVGFVIFNYNYKSRLFFGSYLGVDRRWRSYRIADSIIGAARTKISYEERYRGYLGFVFEVERIDFVKAFQVVKDLEEGNANNIDCSIQIDYSEQEYSDEQLDETEVEIIRKCLRVALYSTLGAYLFVDQNSNALEYTQPCMDLSLRPEEWHKGESKLWLMFVFPETAEDTSDAAGLWRKVVDFVVVEHMGKTYARYNPHIGAKYLKYTERLRDTVLKATRFKKIKLMRPLEKHGELSKFAHRWSKLGIQIKL
jgi:hypothetical protein